MEKIVTNECYECYAIQLAIHITTLILKERKRKRKGGYIKHRMLL